MSVTFTNNIGKFKSILASGKAAEIIAPIVSELTSDIKAATPVLTGKTRDSIKSKQHSNFGHTIYSDAEEAPFIEFGTEDTPAAGMFRKTFDKKAIAIAKQLENDFKTALENIR